MVAQNTVRTYGINQVFLFFKGIWLVLKESSNPIFFGKDLFYYICAHYILSYQFYKYHDTVREFKGNRNRCNCTSTEYSHYFALLSTICQRSLVLLYVSTRFSWKYIFKNLIRAQPVSPLYS